VSIVDSTFSVSILLTASHRPITCRCAAGNGTKYTAPISRRGSPSHARVELSTVSGSSTVLKKEASGVILTVWYASFVLTSGDGTVPEFDRRDPADDLQ
jgi:hypothetical protein